MKISFTVHVLCDNKDELNEPTIVQVLRKWEQGEFTIEIPDLFINDPVIYLRKKNK